MMNTRPDELNPFHPALPLADSRTLSRSHAFFTECISELVLESQLPHKIVD
jgi:hypothetical protein